MKRTERSGFTLLELLIVVIIVGILATFAIPQFIGFVDRSREGEAINIISSILTAELLYRQESPNGVFTGVTSELMITVPTTLKNWTLVTPLEVPGPSTSTPTGIGGTNVRVLLQSNGAHGHSAVSDHEIDGWIDSNGNKVLRHKRAGPPLATTFTNF